MEEEEEEEEAGAGRGVVEKKTWWLGWRDLERRARKRARSSVTVVGGRETLMWPLVVT